MERQRILGVDPGLRITGYGVIEVEGRHVRLIEAGVIRPNARWPLERRLLALFEGIEELLAEFSPDSIVVEELYAQYSHPRTAILMGHARGAILLAAARHGVPCYGYEATLVKRALTGRGHATKAQVAQIICHYLGLAAAPEPPDATDALALALCHLQPRLEGPSRRRRRAWPEKIAQKIEAARGAEPARPLD